MGEFNWKFDVTFSSPYTGIAFGDVIVPFVTDKDTSINKDTSIKKFVDKPPEIIELTSDHEAGTYSLILNETIHPRNESFEEQIDAILSMASRHPSEFPVSVGGDKGHVVVNSPSVNIFPSLEIREASVGLRLLEDSVFRPAIISEAFPLRTSDFDIGPEESLLPVSSNSEVQNMTPHHTIATRDGAIDLYLYSDREVIEYDLSSSFDADERVSPVRVYNDNNERIYSTKKHLAEGSHFDNGILRVVFNEHESILAVYDDGWRKIGELNTPASDGYIANPSNYSTKVDYVGDFNSWMFKGYPVVRYDISDINNFTFSSDESIETGSSDIHYRSVINTSNDEIVLVRTSEDGDFFVGSESLAVKNLDETENYTFFVGVVPDGIDTDDYVRYVYNRGDWRRTMVEK